MAQFYSIHTNGPEGARLYVIKRRKGSLVKVYAGPGDWWRISRNALASILRAARACPHTAVEYR